VEFYTKYGTQDFAANPKQKIKTHSQVIVCIWLDGPQWARTSSFKRSLDHTKRRTTVGRTPLDKWSDSRRDLYLTTHNSQQTAIHAPGEFRTHNLSKRAAVRLGMR